VVPLASYLIRAIVLTAALLFLAQGRTGIEALAATPPWMGGPEPLWLAVGALAGVALAAAARLYLRGLALLRIRTPTRRDLPRHPAVLALVAVLFGPIVEEAVMRGFVMGGLLLPVWGAAAAIVLSALVFGLAHPLPSMPWAAACGIALGLLTLAGSSIWPAVIAHAVVNGWATVRLLQTRNSQ
jgi:membrane protease YdiL (CAAX protease family)